MMFGKIKTKKYLLSITKNRPDLLNEWDYSKNKGLDPDIVSFKARIEVSWICPRRHSYDIAILTRTNGFGCKVCTPYDKYTLQNNFPHLFEEWNFEKNTDFDIDTVTYGSSKIVWWKCKKKDTSGKQL